MAEKKGFVRLNREQKRLLELLKSLDGIEGGFGKLSIEGVRDFQPVRTLPTLHELAQLGYVTVLYDEHGSPFCINLSSWAYCYRWEYFMNLVLPVLLQMLGGVSGGLVVWVLGRVLQ